MTPRMTSITITRCQPLPAGKDLVYFLLFSPELDSADNIIASDSAIARLGLASISSPGGITKPLPRPPRTHLSRPPLAALLGIFLPASEARGVTDKELQNHRLAHAFCDAKVLMST
ncbi:hypothetical protein J6590_049955 [Homalodisca vitripennis]|nr:hypothetical protein J6590_049955 [Homalodisca vitripennis]